MKNLTARQLSLHYKNLAEMLANQYCQLRDRYPFHNFPEIAGAAKRAYCLMQGWAEISLKLNPPRKVTDNDQNVSS